jgi:DNA-binding transcriptional MerR regulator
MVYPDAGGESVAYTVKAVADLAGITVRALHHYDQIGLLKPRSTSPAGYRLYSDSDLRDLQQILFFRELGFGLREIATIVHNPAFDRGEALVEHRRLLEERRKRLDRLIASVDLTIEAIERGEEVAGDTMFQGFDSTQYEQYRKEASERWGKEVVDRSFERVGKLTPAEWARIRAEAADIEEALAGLAEYAPSDPRVQTQIGRWFQHINRHYYECTSTIFGGLGDLYVSDERFRAHYDDRKPGLADFMRAAMQVFVDRAEAPS